MISQKDLADYEFETIEDYFEYIIESKTNGSFTQVRKLVDDLSLDQHNKFLLWMNPTLSKAYLKWR